MKKILITILFIIPIFVNAEEVEVSSTLKDNPNAKTICYNAESNNEDITKATSGTYYECAAIICDNNKNKEYLKKDFTKTLTCLNNNKNPLFKEETQNNPFIKDTICNIDNNYLDQETNAYAFITKKYTYDCNIINDGKNTKYITNKEETVSPDTGVNNYYLTLITLIGIITIVISILNKKNAFKKI